MSNVNVIEPIDTETRPRSTDQVSCRVTNSLLRYLESLHYDASSIVEGLPYSKEFLSNPLNWIPYSVRDELQQRASKLVGDEEIMYKVGLSTPKFDSIRGIEHMVRLLGSPKLAYRSVPKYASLFDRITKFETDIVDDCKAVVTMSIVKGYPLSKSACYYAQGILAAIPTLWGLPSAEVTEMQCQFETHDGEVSREASYGAGKCIYEITWQPMKPLHSRIGDRLLGRDNDRAAALNKLEKNFLLLDQKNNELVQRNNQLSKVREIALGLDSATTVDQVYKLVVDTSRGIPGIRFVLVHELDEARQLVTTPYYSKIRNDSLYSALKSIGFDPDKELGKNPNDRKLVFKVNKLKILQDYVTNPHTIIRERLSELLGDIWPKMLCDSIQRILSVKRFVLVPIIIDTKPWASMSFFLDGNVPIDMLEMVAAHCAIAIKNASTLESLQQHNKELSSVNSIISKTSSSLNTSTVLDTAVEEVKYIFEADAVGLHLINTSGDMLELYAQDGMPVDMVNKVKHIRLADNIIGKHFLLPDQVTTGDFSDYHNLYSELKSCVKDGISVPFTTAVLSARGKRLGMLTVVRMQKGAFNEEEQTLFISIANQLSINIENTKLHRNITNSENRLNRIIQSVSEGITVTDLKGNIQQVNEAVLTMHGYQTKEDLIGCSSFQLIAKKDRDRAIHNFKKALEIGKSGILEYTFIRKDGYEFPAEVSTNLIKDSKDNPIGFVASTRDITERKESELKLRESESKYRLITDSTTDLISVLTFKGIYTYVSPSYRMMGYKPEELVGKSGFDYIHPDDKKVLVPLIGKYANMKLRDLFGLKKESISKEINFRFKDKSGQWHYIEGTANMVDAIKGSGLNIMLTCRDMTERKQAHDLLRQSEEKYRTIFESSNDIIILLDKKGNIVDVNGKVRDIGGYDREDFIGKNFRSFIKIMSKKSIATIAKNLMKRTLGFTVPAYEVEMYNCNGELVNIEINGVAVEKEGEIIGSLATLRDITESKKAETSLKRQKELIDRILESTPNAVLVVDRRSNIVLANRTFCESFSIRKRRIEGMPLGTMIPVASVSDAVSMVLAKNKPQCKVEFSYKVNKRDKSFIASIITMDENEVLIIINDITEERERQERLYLTDRLASVGEMASGIAHELNNPLTGVIGLSQLLTDEEKLPGEIKEDVQAIYSEAQRAAGVVRNLLTFARKHAVVREPIQLNKVLEDVLKLRKYEDKVNNIIVNTSFDTELPVTMADYFQMQQVFLNILLNAENAMTEAHSGGTLTVTTKRVDGTIRISLTDDGPGIPKNNLGHIFDPFFTTKEVGKGTGLGLSICYGIVSSHGGKISVQSELGKGANFIVELPITTN